MKIKYVILSIILIIALSFPISAQDKHADITTSNNRNHEMSTIMGKPVVEETVHSIHMEVWFMTQGQHKRFVCEGISGNKDTANIDGVARSTKFEYEVK